MLKIWEARKAVHSATEGAHAWARQLEKHRRRRCDGGTVRIARSCLRDLIGFGATRMGEVHKQKAFSQKTVNRAESNSYAFAARVPQWGMCRL